MIPINSLIDLFTLNPLFWWSVWPANYVYPEPIPSQRTKIFTDTHNIATKIRDGWRYQNGWIFGKVPNGLWPLIFGKSRCSFFWQKLETPKTLLIKQRGHLPMKRRTNFLIIMVIDCSDYVSSSLVLNTWGGGREPRLNASCLACRCKYLVQVRKPCRKMPALGLFLAEGDKEEEGEWRFRPGQLKKKMMMMMMQWNSSK